MQADRDSLAYSDYILEQFDTRRIIAIGKAHAFDMALLTKI
jgi:hypothetical protein